MAKLFEKRDLITAFDIEGDTVKFAQVTLNNGRRFLKRLLAVKSHSSAVEDLAETIRKIGTHFKLSGSPVFINLPRHMVTVREIRMPSVSREELEGMVVLQSSKLLPYPKEDVVYAYKVIETTREGYSRILLVLTHRDVIDKLLKPFKDSGMDVQKVALDSEALSEWYLLKQTPEQKRAPVALVDISYSCANIQIVYNGRLELTRAVTFSPEEKLAKLPGEIRRTFITYKKESRQDVYKQVLTGSESIAEKEAPLLKKELGLPTSYINLFKVYSLGRGGRVPSREQRERFSFAAVLALAFNFNGLDLNLLPAGIQKIKAAKLAKETFIMTGILSLCILLGAAGIIWRKIDDKNDYLRYVTAEIKKTETRVEKLTGMLNNINIIKDRLDMRGTSVDVIRELYGLVPSNISLTIFDFEEGASCTLRGTADELSNVFKFVTVLEGSPYFKNVKVRYATKRAVASRTFTDFEIISRLAGPSEIEVE